MYTYCVLRIRLLYTLMEHGGCTQVFHECFGSQITTLTRSSSAHLGINTSSGAISAAAASTAGARAIRKQAHITCKDKAAELGLGAAGVEEAITAGAEQEGSNAISKCQKESEDKALQDITDCQTGCSTSLYYLQHKNDCKRDCVPLPGDAMGAAVPPPLPNTL